MRATSPKRRKPPSIDALRTLAEFGQSHNVSETARRVGVTQPVVSRKLKAFLTSEACGATLLKKSGDAPRLTEAGEDVLPAIRSLVAQYDHLLGYLRGQRSAPQVVRLGIGSFAAEHYLPRVLAMLRERPPECEVIAAIARGDARIQGSLDGSFDLAVVTHDPALVDQTVREIAGSRARLAIEPLAEQPMCVIARRGTLEGDELHSTPRRQAAPLSRLGTWELVGLDRRSGIRLRLEEQLCARGSLSFTAEGGGWPAARECARLGLGVAILPLAVLSEADRADFVIRRLSDRFAAFHYLIHRRVKLTEVQQTVKRALQEAVAAQCEQVRREWKDLMGA